MGIKKIILFFVNKHFGFLAPLFREKNEPFHFENALNITH